MLQLHRYALCILSAVLLGACFPTFQSPRIDPGFHVDAGITYIGDQVRNGEEQGPDIMAYLAPTVGFGDRVELGLPVGLYLEEGLKSLVGSAFEEFGESPRTVVVWPYLKFALLPSGAPDHLALILQGAWFTPANVGLRYGRDLGSWEPHVGLSLIFSGGPAGVTTPSLPATRRKDSSCFLSPSVRPGKCPVARESKWVCSETTTRRARSTVTSASLLHRGRCTTSSSGRESAYPTSVWAVYGHPCSRPSFVGPCHRTEASGPPNHQRLQTCCISGAHSSSSPVSRVSAASRSQVEATPVHQKTPGPSA